MAQDEKLTAGTPVYAPTMQRLIDYIRAHHCKAEERHGELYVLDVTYTEAGGRLESWYSIPATWQAVREWLGY